MKHSDLRRRFSASIFLLLLLAAGSPLNAGPLYDPFLEQFQVGSYLKPAQLEMSGIWPGGLLEPVTVDSNWLQAARELLGNPDGHAETLTYRFLANLEGNPYGSFEDMAAAVAFLGSDQASVSMPEPGYLFPERWKWAVFQDVARDQFDHAAQLVNSGIQDSGTRLAQREQFVWTLRNRYLAQLGNGEQRPLAQPWPRDTQLGPYDTGTVWAIWVAHRQAAGLPLLPDDFKGKQQAIRLAGLSRSYLEPADLQASAFSEEMKAGLGATLFTKDDLATHLEKYPVPPSDFSAQGWWVKGQRFLKRGQASHYENLAGREDLKPGWRMDIWRRASELRLLKGQWTAGLTNLDRALAIAKVDGGTKSQRRRLRHWVEQAAVLALAQDKEETAWTILDKGIDTFSGEAGEVYQDEIRHWNRLRRGEMVQDGDFLETLDLKVESGQAMELVAPTGQAVALNQASLIAAADEPLWDLWIRWGVALATEAPAEGPIKERALAYSAILNEGQGLADPDAQVEIALRAIALRFQGRDEILEPLIDKLVDRDVGLLAGWQTVPLPSPIPGLLPVLRRSQLDMHAALGLSLAVGDMRGIVGLGFEIPGTGLTRQEKRTFLYPLPQAGPIRDALLASDSEPALILAVARNESLFEPAVRSRAGALGWMQIMPFHFENRGASPAPDNWAVPGISINLGDQLLSEGRIRYGKDPYMTLAAYNAGPGAASRWMDQLGGSASRQEYLAWIGYTETRKYVEKVLIDREIYDWILAGRPGQ